MLLESMVRLFFRADYFLRQCVPWSMLKGSMVRLVFRADYQYNVAKRAMVPLLFGRTSTSPVAKHAGGILAW